MRKTTFLLLFSLMTCLISFGQKESLKFNTVTYKGTQKIVNFKVVGVSSTEHASQLMELILKQDQVLKVDFNKEGNCMAVLKLETTADDLKKVLLANNIDFDYSTVSVKDGTELEYPVLKGDSEEEKTKYEAELNRWNNRHPQ